MKKLANLLRERPVFGVALQHQFFEQTSKETKNQSEDQSRKQNGNAWRWNISKASRNLASVTWLDTPVNGRRDEKDKQRSDERRRGAANQVPPRETRRL